MNNGRGSSPLPQQGIGWGKREEVKKELKKLSVLSFSLPSLNASILMILPLSVANFRGRASSPYFPCRNQLSSQLVGTNQYPKPYNQGKKRNTPLFSLLSLSLSHILEKQSGP